MEEHKRDLIKLQALVSKMKCARGRHLLAKISLVVIVVILPILVNINRLSLQASGSYELLWTKTPKRQIIRQIRENKPTGLRTSRPSFGTKGLTDELNWSRLVALRALKSGPALQANNHLLQVEQVAPLFLQSSPLLNQTNLRESDEADLWWQPNAGQAAEKRAGELRQQKQRHKQATYILSPVSGRLLDITAANAGQPMPIRGVLQADTGFTSLEGVLAAQNEPYKASFHPVGFDKTTGRIYSAIVDECHTLRANTQLSKDEIDPITNLLVRSCKGLVQVNRCEGSCGSSVQPAIKSASGFRKYCSCCNEGSFRKIQVRLTECYSALDNRRISSDSEQVRSYMDIEVEEPIDCKCRACDGTI